jgi:site-specific DNA-methyltransferase (adenine-specific)
MVEKAAFSLKQRNPDVLTSIANLSNDEVFTPPSFANQMLDTIEEAWAKSNDGAIIWEDKKVSFLDPFTKSGVFLREITSRLSKGLKKQIPDDQERVNHILTKQVFGVAITELTSLLARRSVYCSKHANGKHSICSDFDTPQGNIWFERTEHTWVGGKEKVVTVDENGNEAEINLDGKCQFCGAPRRVFGRNVESETYAYPFTHTKSPSTWLAAIFGENMKFDVVIGNPPYQLAGGAGGTSDSSIYHQFVEQARKLEPRLLSMVIPARWLAGGRGMDEFRKSMLGSKTIRTLVDFPVSKEVFPGVEVKGGICYFLWDGAHDGDAQYVSIRDGRTDGPKNRNLAEFDVFVRSEVAVRILRKVLAVNEGSVVENLTGDTPFGIATNFTGFRQTKKPGDIALHYVQQGKRGVGYIPGQTVTKNRQLISDWKILVPKAGSDGGQKIPDSVLGKPKVVEPESVCTQSFLAFWFQSEAEARNFEAYYATKFFRFIVSLRKITQDALKGTYRWVPSQDLSRRWADEELYAKYKLTQEEIDFIESMIRPMELEGA